MNIEQHLSSFFAGAEAIIDDGLAHARQDDPHRFQTLGREFDGGVAMRRLAIDYLQNDRMRVALQLIGQRDGEEKVIEVFATTVQGAQPGGLH